MKIKLFLFLVSVFSHYSYTMQYCLSNRYKKEDRCAVTLLRKTIFIPKVPVSKKKLEIIIPLIPPTFCDMLRQKIVTISSLCKHYVMLRDAAEVVNTLAQTNKFLNQGINDDQKTLTLIKELSKHFNRLNITVAKILCTKAANNRYALQQLFCSDWNRGKATVATFPKLKRMGVDLEFTYCLDRTVLLQNVCWLEYGYAEIGKWLIENGANINAVDSEGCNAAMIAMRTYNEPLIPLLLEHSALRIDHQDNKGNTVLHYGIQAMMSLYVNGSFGIRANIFKTIVQLLDKKAKVLVKNNENKRH